MNVTHKTLLILSVAITIFSVSGVAKATTSPDGARITKTSTLQIIFDSSDNTWTLSSAGKVIKNHNTTAPNYTSNTSMILFYEGKIFNENSSNAFHSWNGSSWVADQDPRIPSSNGKTVAAGESIVDSSRNIWTIVGGLVYENGSKVGYADNITQLEYSNGKIYAKNIGGAFEYWSGSTWVAGSPGSTTTSPSDCTASLALPTSIANLKLGYSSTPVFCDNFQSLSTIDTNDSKENGKKWYVSSPGKTTAEIQDNVNRITISNKMLRLDPKGAFLQSVNVNASKEIVGTSFSIKEGGGAYFEAKIAYGDTAVTTTNGWPAFWLNPAAHIVNQDTKLPWNAANPDYHHYFELDIMEYFNNTKGFNFHINPRDWYGEYNKTCPGGYCVTDGGQFVGPGKKGYYTSASDPQVVPGANLNFHTYGALWVPATSTTGGYIEFYVDGVPAQGQSGSTKYTYTSSIPETPQEPKPPFKFKVADSAPMAIILNNGADAFMYVEHVSVWQK